MLTRTYMQLNQTAHQFLHRKSSDWYRSYHTVYPRFLNLSLFPHHNSITDLTIQYLRFLNLNSHHNMKVLLFHSFNNPRWEKQRFCWADPHWVLTWVPQMPMDRSLLMQHPWGTEDTRKSLFPLLDWSLSPGRVAGVEAELSGWSCESAHP